MICEELKEMYELYAMGVSDDPERSEINSHLAQGCVTCTKGVKHAFETVSIIGTTAFDVAPPTRLRARVMASIRSEPAKHSFWNLPYVWMGLAAALAMVALGLWNREVGMDRSLEEARQQISALSQTQERDQSTIRRVNAALNFLNQPETRLVTTSGKAIELPPKARVFVNAKTGVLMMAGNLPKLGPGKIYEMWLIPKGGAAPVPAGLFQSDESGTAMHLRAGTVDLASTAAVAITVEPESGSAAPTTTPILVMGLSD